MRRVYGFIILLAIVPLFIAACGSSPKSQANKFAERMPEEIGDFELEPDDRIELTAESIGSTGHVTLRYTNGSSDVYVIIDVYGTEAAAEVAVERRYRDLRLLGYVFDADRAPRSLTAQIVDVPQGRVAIFERDEAIIELQYIKEEVDDALDEPSWELFLEQIRTIDSNLE